MLCVKRALALCLEIVCSRIMQQDAVPKEYLR